MRLEKTYKKLSRFRIAVTFTLISAIALGWVYLYLNYNLKSHAHQKARENLLKDTAFAKSFMTDYASRGSLSYGVDEVADNVGKDLGLRVTIMGRYGTVIGDSEASGAELQEMENHFDRPEIRQAMDEGRGEAERFSITRREDMLYAASVFGDGYADGVIRLGMPLATINAMSANLNRLLIVATTGAFLLAGFLIIASAMSIPSPPPERIPEPVSNDAPALQELEEVPLDVSVKTPDELVPSPEEITKGRGVEMGVETSAEPLTDKAFVAPCALRPIANRAISLMKKSAKDKSVSVKTRFPKKMPKILADKARVTQHFLRLVDNAIMNAPKKGKITIIAKINKNKRVIIEARNGTNSARKRSKKRSTLSFTIPNTSIKNA